MTKVLHLSFHGGCLNEMAAICKTLGINHTGIQIQNLPAYFLDPQVSKGNVLYNIGHDRAERIWEKNKDYFEKFDGIFISDTTPLARIFLQNGWTKPLYICIFSRFDYYDGESLDCDFPDKEWYELMKGACVSPNVKIAFCSVFEKEYAKEKGVDLGNRIINIFGATIPNARMKFQGTKKTFYIVNRGNELTINLQELLRNKGVDAICTTYNVPFDLVRYRGIIHLPYAPSNLMLYENLALGLIHFVPTPTFVQQMAKDFNYWFQGPIDKIQKFSDWYNDSLKDCIVYFSSWDDLVEKLKTTDYTTMEKKVLEWSRNHKNKMLALWKDFLLA